MKHARTLTLGLGLGAGLVLILATLAPWSERNANDPTHLPSAQASGGPGGGQALALAAGSESSPAPGSAGAARALARGRVRGRFVDFATGDPIVGAIFHARHEPGVTRSDEAGEFHAFEGRRTVEFEAGADGYCVTRGTLVQHEIDDTRPIEIPLVRSTAIEGVVVDSDGVPVSKPYVYSVAPSKAVLANPVPEGYPDSWELYPEGLGGLLGTAEGTFQLAGLVPGATGYELQVTRSGFQKSTVPLFCAVTRGPTRVRVVLERVPLPPGGSVQGQVYLNGEPTPATVWFRLADDNWLKTSSEDEDDLGFVFESVPPGTGQLIALPGEWLVVDGLIPDVPWLPGAQVQLTVNDGDRIVQDLWLRIPMATISGRVTHGDPNRTLGRLDLWAASPLVSVWAVADDEGRYAIEVPDTGHEYRVHSGSQLTSVKSAPVEPGSTDVDLVQESFPTFTLQVLDAETKRRLRTSAVMIRPGGEQGPWYSCWGPPYEAPPGPLEIRVRSPRHVAGQIEVHMAPGHANHFEIDLGARR